MMMRRTARVLAASVGVAAAVTVAAPAHALPQSPQVTVFGTALCPSTDPANRLTISTGFETKNALPDPESGSYSVTFNQIPPNGIRANARIVCDDGTFTKAFTINRPTIGSAQLRSFG
ncbi:hypothetical protein [Pseudofrankia saprophytica]|uniref:hypothetical protein n=1 Tax=Pseudofrankia saprophytica TaxID=298655 RepID=UPI000234C214|nr:hypothetical protein [Pseudofrankia saprophytica]